MDDVQNLYLLMDGTQASPGDVSKGDDGVLRHKNGVKVAMRGDGKPETVGDRSAMNAPAAESKPEDRTAPAPVAETAVIQPKQEERKPAAQAKAPAKRPSRRASR